MPCPNCRSDFLMIRHKTGFERLRVLLTGTREYRCRDCDQKFRAADRRARPRIQKASSAHALEKPLAGIPSGIA